MSRKTTTLKVENMDGDEFTVYLKENLSWGETQEIEDALTSGANLTMTGAGTNQDVDASFDTSALTEAKYKTIEVCVHKIEAEEEEVEWSKEWMNQLTKESGDKLYEEVNKLTSDFEKKR